MATPVLEINGTDYAEHIKTLKITMNDLDADGSGRNILDGTMYRSRIATKVTIDTALLDKRAAGTMTSLISDLYSGSNYVSVSYLHPETSSTVTTTMYCSSVNTGEQRREGSAVYYDGVSFELIER